ncbi:MAG: CDP-alcohol phosphatidyltransferase family protein [Desulfuromonas sp.]|nr:CDP-alcohol phosphatidyltransferase family protein [Desulfuromonas sp.]
MVLAIPVCLLILAENYQAVLWIAFIAGFSDAIDGWLARMLNCESRYGAIVDPLSDKTLLVGTYIGLAVVGLLPWWLAAIVVLRDVLIVSGALVYHWLFGRYEMAPSLWGKVSTCVQIAFALMLLTHQLYPVFPLCFFQIGTWLVILMSFISGGHYVYIWGGKALVAQQDKRLSNT